MVEKRTVGIIIGILLIAVMAAYFIFKVLGLQPEKDIFPKDKEKLVRYYACSLAICKYGCESDFVKGICLDNDTFTHECNLECYDECIDRFGSCVNPGDCCGPNWNLSVSLAGRLGVYGHHCIKQDPVRWWDCALYGTDLNIGLEFLKEREDFPLPIGFFPSGRLYTVTYEYETGWPGLVPSFSMQIPDGGGDVFIPDKTAIEEYGCLGGGGWQGFEYCEFNGNIMMWSSFYEGAGYEGADIFFNSTISGDWWHEIRCKEPLDEEGNCYQRINLDETADYTLELENQLGSGYKFKLDVSDNLDAANCVLWKEDPIEDLGVIEVNYGETVKFYMSCTPTEAGSYSISIDAWPITGFTGKQTNVKLVTSDFTWEVSPGETLGEEVQKISKTDAQRYTVVVDSDMGENMKFKLELSVPSDLICEFEEGGGTIFNLFVPDEDFNSTTFSCSGDPGNYKITITASAGGIKDEKTRKLEIQECGGEIKLEFDPSDSVNSGTNITISATGVEGCGDYEVDISMIHPDLVVKHCGVGGWDIDGETCSMVKKTVNTPGIYPVYAFIDTNDDGDTEDYGENVTVNLTIKKPAGFDGSCGAGGGCEYTADWGCLTGTKGLCRYCKCTAELVGLCVGWGADDCGEADVYGSFVYALDPQSDRCNSPSNLCCVSGEDYYSSGPPGVPCLSPDDNKYNDKTENWWYGGYDSGFLFFPESWGVDNSRHVLVEDGNYATFKVDWCDEHRDGGSFPADDMPDCLGRDGPPDELSSQTSECVSTGFAGQYVCKSSISDPDQYTSWQFIRVAPQDEYRPVYGVKIRIAFKSECDAYPDWASFGIYLHDKDGNWFKIGSATISGVIPAGEWRSVTRDIVPASGYSWDNIDAMFIGLLGTNDCGNVFTRSAYIDYIGLLVKGTDIPYCTDGNGDYHRIVDDGKTCYWGLDCPSSGTTADTGWKGNPSPGVGPFTDGAATCNCNNPDVTCSQSYCSFTFDGKELCFYDVACENGGWSGNHTICEPDKDCGEGGC